MSLLKPDINYDPSSRAIQYLETTNTAFQSEKAVAVPKISHHDLFASIKLFLNNYTDADFIRFYNISKTTFLTNKNVKDGVSFLEKFIPLYVGTLKKTFPNKDWSVIENSLFLIKDSVAESLKHDNVENLYLLPMVIGILEAQLNYENY